MTQSLPERIDFEQIARAALNDVNALLMDWLPNGNKAGPEWKSVNPTRSDRRAGSFSVNMTNGKWGDFASGDTGGDLISLSAYLFYGGDQVAAARELAQRFGIAVPPAHGEERQRQQIQTPAPESPPVPPKKSTPWEAQRVAPETAPPPPKAHSHRGVPQMSWHYKDADGRTLGYVHRFITSDGSKEVMPVCWARNSKSGVEDWHWMHFAEPRCLFGLDTLAAKPEATVLVVEGEKCVTVGAPELPDLALMSWPGGTNAEHKADWAPLAGRKIIIWPDCDAKRVKLSKEEEAAGIDPLSKPYLPETKQPGWKAALKIAVRLHEQGCKVWLVRIPAPGEKPDGWDIADAVEEGLRGETLANWIRDNAKVYDQEAPIAEGSEPISTAEEAAAGLVEEKHWTKRLLFKNGELSDCLSNIFDILTNTRQWDGVIAFDELSQRTVKLKQPPFFGGEIGEWLPTDDSRTTMWLSRKWSMTPSSARVAEAVETISRGNAFHPVRDWLRALPAWDGTPRLSMWLTDFLGVKNNQYSQRVGTWFIMGMVARAMRPGCKFDYCLVLEGAQGKKKSTALSVLAGEWFGDTDLDLHNKDSMIALQGKWLYEFGELGSLARAESLRQKSFLSRRIDEFRPPYGRRDIKCPRQLVFAGTTNEWEWNKDPTGGRRFWPVEVSEIDIDGIINTREQLFAEALAYFDAGNRYWPSSEEQRALFDPEQLRREQPEAYIDILHDWVDKQIGEFSIATAISDGLGLDAAKMTRDIQTRVGTALRKLGCTKFEKRNGVTRYWYKPPVRNGAMTTSAQPAQQSGGANEYF
ncbi:MAG: virulence-associated family protein [Proteobacteria bacterium]|nr:virulence-associated family protein [Pseudomonadota bacterium]